MNRDELQALVIAPETTLREALGVIDRGRRQIALVVSEDGTLCGTLTDGDVRRGILRGIELDAPVSDVMNAQPTTMPGDAQPNALRRLMRQTKFQHVPLVDGDGRLVDLATQDALFGVAPKRTRVVLMAGGLGKRLRPLTETVPKPMLPVGGKPILEQIIAGFADQGFERFTISVNYRREMVQEHFGDGSALGVHIDYIEEDQPLGTAGALSLMKTRPQVPFIVMNGDLLVNIDFQSLLAFHAEKGASATLVAREYEQQVPYGVVRTEDDFMTGIEEKPIQTFLVNGGVYVISPEALDLLERDRALDMPDLLTALTGRGDRVAVWPLRDYWRDIGRVSDLEAARSEFGDVFGDG